MSTNISKNKQVKEVKFHATLTFTKKTYYSADLSFEDFAKKHKDDNPDWDDEFVKQVWMELCAEANKRGEVKYKDAEGEDWDKDDFEGIFAECYLDEAVDKANEKLKKD
jgi:hypothetical protein